MLAYKIFSYIVYCITNTDFITYISLSNKVIIYVQCEIHKPKRKVAEKEVCTSSGFNSRVAHKGVRKNALVNKSKIVFYIRNFIW